MRILTSQEDWDLRSDLYWILTVTMNIFVAPAFALDNWRLIYVLNMTWRETKLKELTSVPFQR